MRIENDILSVAQRDPYRPAVEVDGQVWSFGRLDTASSALAETIRAALPDTPQPVWILTPHGLDFILATLAVWRSDHIVVPINPRLADAELKQLARTCVPVALIADFVGAARARTVLESVPEPPCIMEIQDARVQVVKAAHPQNNGASRVFARQHGRPGVVYFTSGSTGFPKAILLTHRNIVTNARATAEAFGLRPEDRSLVCMSTCHSYTLTKQLLAHLGRGGCVVMGPEFFEPAAVWARVVEARCTTLYAVPSMHVMLHYHLVRSRLDPPHLRLLVTGGAPMPYHVQVGLVEALPRAGFISSYGLSEAGPCVSALPPAWAVRKVGSVGLPIPGVELAVLDERGLPVGRGQNGEVCVRSPSVMAGYLDNPTATARALRGGWLHTGDIGRLDTDGCLYLAGRKDEMILRGGENIYPAEVENVLCAHPAVREAAVVAVPHDILGHDLVAAVVRMPDGDADGAALSAFCRKRLATFKVPRAIRFLDVLPKTTNGKLDRTLLQNLWQQEEK